MLRHCQRVKENVVLWAQTQVLAHVLDVVADVVAGDRRKTARRRDKTY